MVRSISSVYGTMQVKAYKFDGYWKDMRSIESFYHANMESTKTTNEYINIFKIIKSIIEDSVVMGSDIYQVRTIS